MCICSLVIKQNDYCAGMGESCAMHLWKSFMLLVSPMCGSFLLDKRRM